MDAVAAGFGADVDDGVADAGGSGVEDFVFAADAEREDVDQRIAGVAGFEDGLAADGGDAETVAIVGDAFDDAVTMRVWRGLPKRRESMTAMGRAPMVKMSRRMPPTPVAAPWKGSM